MEQLLNFVRQLPITFEDLLVVITILVGFIVIKQIQTKVASENAVASIIRFLLGLASWILLFTGLLYWRFRTTQFSYSTLHLFVTSLDIVLAHVVLSLPLLFESLYILNVFGRVTGSIFAGVIALLLAIPIEIIRAIAGSFAANDTSKKTADNVGCYLILTKITADSLRFIITISGSLGILWLLLLGTTDVQKIFFGAYDESLGWNFSTTFKFTNLFAQVGGLIQALSGDETISVIVTFLAIAISALILIGGSAEAVQHIGEGFRTDKAQKEILQIQNQILRAIQAVNKSLSRDRQNRPSHWGD